MTVSSLPAPRVRRRHRNGPDEIGLHVREITRGLQIVNRLLTELSAARRTVHKESARQIHQIAASIREFGFLIPILIDENNRIIAGHARVAAAKQLGMKEVPTIRIEHLTDAQKRAFIIADNRLAELAVWDQEALAIEFRELLALNLDFDLEITGFATAEIDLLIDGPTEAEAPDPADEVPEPEGPAVSRVGDLWMLGRHRLLCGNALEAADLTRLMDGLRARLVFTDPPYNVPINGHVCGLGRIRHREFAMASGEMSDPQFITFLATALGNMVVYLVDGGLLFVCMDWRHLHALLTAAEQVDLQLLNLPIWRKTNSGMGSLYRSQHELVPLFKHGTAPHINNVELGRYGRHRTNVWDYAGVNTLRPGRMAELAMHPTVKPVALVMDAIKDVTRRGDIVLDPFAGSGTTLIAAEKTGRIARCLELDPLYVDTIIRRWERLTGQSAVHAASGLAFAQIADQRAATPSGEGV